MAKENREIPRTQTSAPVKPADTTTDVPQPRREDEKDAPPRHHTSDGTDAGGDLMPKGFDEPGAGL